MNVPLRDTTVDAASQAPARPQVFVRAITTPPGPPWEQARAARLEAQMGAPLPIGELMHQLRRLAPWAPGRPGRYAALYLRAREFREPFETTVEVDGQALRAAFGAPGLQLGRFRGPAMALLLLIAAGVLVGGGIALALQARGEAATRLEAAETLSSARVRMADAYRRRVDAAGELGAMTGAARPLSDVLDELAWMGAAKGPEARLMGVHWEHGLLAVESRGEQSPFPASDRPLERAAKPVRPGVWLWAVGARRPAASAPVAAGLAR
jgi:hypothetical protein